MGSYQPTRAAGSRCLGHLVLPVLLACCALLSGRAGAAGHSVTPATPAPDSIGVLRPPLTVALDPFLADLEERTFRFFWETGNGPTPPLASSAAGGSGVTGPLDKPAPDSVGVLHPPLPVAVDPFLADLQERTFRFFWETGNAPTPPFASSATGGVGLADHWATPAPEATAALDPFFADLEER